MFRARRAHHQERQIVSMMHGQQNVKIMTGLLKWTWDLGEYSIYCTGVISSEQVHMTIELGDS